MLVTSPFVVDLTWQVARREYETETNDGRTTKRRKTGGTVMFEVTYSDMFNNQPCSLSWDSHFIWLQEPRRRSTRITPKAKTPRSIAKVKIDPQKVARYLECINPAQVN